ncbi:MAG TPA: LysR substrate-binding domain-containing protein [Acidimicrobiia bacterium]|jgi:DNA-binding transcriptional LysR family regulator|nr:LysR substrate-binding domain-containing protein [Acidimicrobiia bacterium]
MELRQVEYVLAVIDHGSFTAGAHAEGVAQPSLSEAIRRLEEELGARLFHRVGRRVELTDAGHAFEGPARRMVRERALALEAVGSVRALERGTLDLVSLPTLAGDPLAAWIGRFRRAHPGVGVRIAEPEDARAVAERVADGTSEVGLAELPASRDDLVAIALMRQEIVAVCPPGTELRASGRMSIAHLATLPMIAAPPGRSTRDLAERAFAAAGVEIQIAVETSQREAIAPLVLEGAGYALLPRGMADSVEARGAVVARIAPALTRSIGLLHRPSPLTPAARAFVELARETSRAKLRL